MASRKLEDRKRKRKLVSQPNKSMPISEIVRRFSRGLDAGVNATETSNHPDQDVDLERMSRMDRLDKAYTADEMRRENEQIQAKADAELRRLKEEGEAKRKRIEAKLKKDAALKAQGPQAPGPGSGIGSA